MTILRVSPSRAWLKARAESARELWDAGEIDLDELNRVERDANIGFFSGPMRYVSGRVSNEETFLKGTPCR